MGLFSKLSDGLVTAFNFVGSVASISDGQKENKQQENQAKLREYRSRGIYVLAVHVDGILWQYFFYPSEELRVHAVKNIWGPFFSKLGISWRSEFLDPK